MELQNEIRTLANKALKMSMKEASMSEANFTMLKNDALALLKESFGELSREYRVVYWTQSPATIAKVLNHIIARESVQTTERIAVNL